jgi:DNA helicase-2/ATP-dependent DNA helicase PcrA
LITVKAYFNDRDLQEADAMSKSLVWGVVPKLRDKCFKSGAMDFDDLLLKTNELLNRFPEVLGKYQNRFRYILVDEYQDTNHSQYLIVRALSDKFKIYVLLETMRKVFTPFEVPINNILNFQKDYEGVKTSVWNKTTVRQKTLWKRQIRSSIRIKLNWIKLFGQPMI